MLKWLKKWWTERKRERWISRRCEQILCMKYPAECFKVDNYYIAYLIDFGWSTCSGVGDTEREAFDSLYNTKRDVIRYYLETGKEIPEPSVESYDHLWHV